MFSDDQLLQLNVTLILAVIAFVIAFSLKPRVAATALLLLIPFQPIDTKYASANVALTFVLFIALLIKGVRIRVPMVAQIIIVFFVYMIALGLVYPATIGQHAVYVFSLVSAFLVLWITYDLFMRLDHLNDAVNLFVIMNILVVIYSVAQLASGSGEKIIFFGIDEFHMNHTRSDRRLTGTFGAAGIAAEYTVIMLFVILYQFLRSPNGWIKGGLGILGAINVLLLIATGNRGGFLVLVGAGLVFLWLFRRTLGIARTITIAATATVFLAVGSMIATSFTDFDSLFERLAETEVSDSGIPDTRSIVWPVAWQAIEQKPIIGHGPRLRFDGEESGARFDGHLYIMYPHNLYLFMLFTVGAIGLLAFMVFLLTPLFRCINVVRHSESETYEVGFARLGIVLMIVILVDGIKIDFMRYALVDYWHFVFALIGLLIATCDRAAGLTNGVTSHASGSLSYRRTI